MAVNVPAQYQQWVNTAARGTGLPPAVVAAQINQESGFNPRATSPTGAQGIAQFEPATWRSQGVPGSPYDPNAALRGYIKLMGSLLHQYGGNVSNALAAYNAGPGNLPAGMGYARTILSNAGGGGGSSSVRPIPGMPAQQAPTGGQSSIQVPYTTQNFDQAGYNQAQRGYIAGSFLKSPGANPFGGNAGLSSLFQAGRLSSAPPNVQDFVSQQTHMQQIATGQLQQLAGVPLVNAHQGATGDVNPIPGAVIGRTDMGVDANLKPGAPILAPNDGKVVAVTPGWYKSQPYVAIQLTSGPNRGKVMYVAEQITGVPRVGQTVRRGQPIARYAPSGTGIEIGWANPSSPTQTLAQATTGYTEGQQTRAGTNFRSYLGAVSR